MENPGLEFEFFLAEQLHMSHRQLMELDYAELVLWNAYYQRKAQREELAMKQARKS